MRLLRECNRLLADWESVVSETRKSETEVIGKYRLGCHPSVALYALDPFLKNLYQEQAGLELELIHGLSRVVCEGVVSGKIDFGLVINPTPHADLVIVELAKDEVTFWRSSKCLPSVLLCNPELFQTQSLLKKAKGMRFERTVASESLEVLTSLAKSHVGTAILPERIVKILAPSLAKVEGAPSFQDRLALVYRSDLRKTAGAKVILAGLKSLANKL